MSHRNSNNIRNKGGISLSPRVENGFLYFQEKDRDALERAIEAANKEMSDPSVRVDVMYAVLRSKGVHISRTGAKELVKIVEGNRLTPQTLSNSVSFRTPGSSAIRPRYFKNSPSLKVAIGRRMADPLLPFDEGKPERLPRKKVLG